MSIINALNNVNRIYYNIIILSAFMTILFTIIIIIIMTILFT